MRPSSFFVALTTIFIGFTANVSGQQVVRNQFYCGISLGTGFEHRMYRSAGATAVLRQMRRDGARHVQLSAYLTQYGATSTRTQPVTPMPVLRAVIRKAHRLGLKVFLKPVIDVKSPNGDYFWRGYIPGTATWFNKVYTPWITGMARLAQQERVDIFAVGSEYVAAQKNTNAWYEVIRKVRVIYKGKLTYVANHDSYNSVRFFPRLDFISISAYFRLRNTRAGPYPDLAGTKRLYEKEARKLEAWRVRRGLTGKKVLFAEFGIQSKGNGVVYYEPWNWTSNGPLDLSEQVKLYEAFFSVFLRKSWSLGVMVWHYELNPNAGKFGPTRTGYTPQNKPALQVIRRYFKELC